MKITRFLFETDQGIVYEASGMDINGILESVEMTYALDPRENKVVIVLRPSRMRQDR